MRKKNVLLNTLFIVLLLSTTVNGQYSSLHSISCQQVQAVGIPSAKFNYFASSQEKSQWCWAASIQMVLNYYGVAITQSQIVQRTYGSNLVNWTGSFQAITANLNNWSVDNKGKAYTVTASLNWGAPHPTILIQQLSQGRPIILAYASGPNSGHAVVITGVTYVNTYQGPYIQTIIVRDPWPSPENIKNTGRVEYPGAMLASRMQAYWYILVY